MGLLDKMRAPAQGCTAPWKQLAVPSADRAQVCSRTLFLGPVSLIETAALFSGTPRRGVLDSRQVTPELVWQ